MHRAASVMNFLLKAMEKSKSAVQAISLFPVKKCEQEFDSQILKGGVYILLLLDISKVIRTLYSWKNKLKMDSTRLACEVQVEFVIVAANSFDGVWENGRSSKSGLLASGLGDF
jgi:hypothetical protein